MHQLQKDDFCNWASNLASVNNAPTLTNSANAVHLGFFFASITTRDNNSDSEDD